MKRHGLFSLNLVILLLISACPAMADGPAVKLRMVENRVQVGTDSDRSYLVEWYSPSGLWQTLQEHEAIPAAVGNVWLRGVFQPEDATSWEMPEAAGLLVVPAPAKVGQAADVLWSTVVEHAPDGSAAAVSHAPTFEAAGSVPWEDAPAALADRANLIWYNSSSRAVAEWILNTSGTTQATFAVSNAPSGYVPAGMGDVEGDGVSDIVLYNTNLNKVAVWFLDDEGRYRTNLLVNGGLPMTSGWLLRAIGDIDTDGRVDFIWHSSVSRMVAYWILNVDGTLMTYGFCTNTAMSAGWSLNASGDIDGDGTVDLLWHNSSTRRVAYWFLNPDGTLRASGYCTTNTMAAGWEMRAAGQIKGDGTLALLWHNANTKKVAYWMLDTNGLLAASGFCSGSTMANGWELKAMEDINGDHRDDVIWFNTQTRRAAYWMLETNGALAASGFCADATVPSGYNLYGAGVCQPSSGPGPGDFWTEVAGLPTDNIGAGAGALGSYVYYVGGLGDITMSNVFRYNGTSWGEVSGLPSPLWGHGVCAYDGNLYAMGGFTELNQFRTNVFYFNGTDWSEVAGLATTVVSAASAVLHDRLYLIGGFNDAGVLTNVFEYDGASWSEVEGLPGERYGMGAATLGNYLYVAGGVLSDYNTATTNVFCFDGTNWTEVAGLPVALRNHTLTALDGALYAVAGLSSGTVRTNVYRYLGGSWAEVAGLPEPRRGHSAAALGSYLYVMGGEEYGPATNVYRYTPEMITADAGSPGVVLPTFETEPPAGGAEWTAADAGPDVPGEPVEFFAGDPSPAGTSDRANIIWYNSSSLNVAEWVLNTSGTLMTPFSVSNAPSGYVPAGMGDVEGDGISDIILYNTNLNKVAVWFLDSEGRYDTNLLVNGGLPMTSGWMLRAIGDIDSDGRADLVWHHSVSRLVAYWILNTDGSLMTYGLCTNIAMSAGWSLDGSGDIDGDGTVDLLWYNSTTRKVAYWFLNPDGTLRQAGYCTTNTMANAWAMKAVGDIKGDGTMGLLWHNASTKKVAYWLLGTNGLLNSSGFCTGSTMSGGWELKAGRDINMDGTMDAIWFNTSIRLAAYWMLDTNGLLASSGYITNQAVSAGYGIYGAGVCHPTNIPGPGNVWVEVAGLPMASDTAGAAALGSYIYYVGGFTGMGSLTNVYRYNGTSWAEVASLPVALTDMSVCTYDGDMYTIGGVANDGMLRACTNVYRFDGALWTEVAGMPEARFSGASAVLGDRLYFIGGSDMGFGVFTNVYRYDGATWTEMAGLPLARKEIGAATLGGYLYVAGGRDSMGLIATNVFRYDGTNWTETASLPEPCAQHTLTALDGALYAVAGVNGLGNRTNVYMFNGSSWSEVAGLPAPRAFLAAAALGGYLYALGGYNSGMFTNVYRYQPGLIAADAPGDGGTLAGGDDGDPGGGDQSPDGGQPIVSTFETEPPAGGAEWTAADAGPDVPGDPSDFVAGDPLPSAPGERANLIWYSSTAGTVAEWILNTAGTTQATFAVSNAPSGYVPAGMGDVEGDGISDIVLYNTNLNKVAVWFLDDEGHYRTNLLVNGGLPMTSGWMLRAIGDIDSDGRADLVWHHSVSRLVAYWILNVDGTLMTYGLCTNTPMSAGWSLNASGDIDNNGTVDLLWHNSSTRRVAYWFLNPDGTLRQAGYCSTNTMAAGWEMKGAGDIKGDNTLGILWHNANTKKVAYWMLETNGLLTTSGFCTNTTMSGGWEIKAVRDINMDGTADIIWFNTTTRRAAYWLLNNDGTLNTSGYCADSAVSAGYSIYGAGVCQPSAGPGNVWVPIAGLPVTNCIGGAGVIGSDIYHAGGWNSEIGAVTNVYRFNGTSWTEVRGLPRALNLHAVCSYLGELYALGGYGEMTFITNVFKFNGTAWTEMNSLPDDNGWAGVAVLRDRLYYIGGKPYIGMSGQTNVYQYDGTNWSEVAGLPESRWRLGAATLGDYLYAAGGWDSSSLFTTNVFRYDGTNWSEIAGMPAYCANMSLTALDGALYCVGGEDGLGVKTNVYKFDGATWTEVAGLPVPCSYPAAAAMGGYLYSFSACDTNSMGQTNAYRYTPGMITAENDEVWLPTFDEAPVSGETEWTAADAGPDVPGDPSDFVAGDPLPAAPGERANLIWYSSTAGTVAEWILNTAGTTQATFAVSNAPSGYVPAGMGDVEGDGISDIVLYNTNLNKVAVWFLDDDGHYRTNLLVNGGLPMTSGWMLRAIGDIDSDGRADLVWHHSVSRLVAYWILNVDGSLMTYGLCTNTPMSAGWSLNASGDIDNNGTVDLLWHNSSTRRVAYWFLNPDGTLRQAGYCSTNTMAAGWEMKGAGDIKGDNTLGILWHNANTKKVAYWMLETNGLLTTSGFCTNTTMSGGWEIKAVRDINMDGTADIIWFNTTTRRAAYWLLNNDGTLNTSSYCADSAVSSGYSIYGAGVCQPSSPPTPGTWTEVIGLPLDVYAAAAAVYSNMAYYMGGYNDDGLHTNVLAFDGTSWSEVLGLPPHGDQPGHRLAGMGVVYSNKLFYIAGMNSGSTATNTLAWYNGSTWTAGGESQKLPRNIGYGSALVYSNRLYSIGGWDDGVMVTNVYRFNDTEWREDVGLPAQRAAGGAALYKGCIYYVGGIVGDDPKTNVYRFDGTAWTEVSGLPTGRYYNACAVVGEYLYSSGGADQTATSHTNMYRFDGTSWAEVSGMPFGPYCHAAFVYSNAMYVAGGNDMGNYLTNCYRYNP